MRASFASLTLVLAIALVTPVNAESIKQGTPPAVAPPAGTSIPTTIVMCPRTVIDGPLTIKAGSKVFGLTPATNVTVATGQRLGASGVMEDISGATLLAGVTVGYVELTSDLTVQQGSIVGALGQRSKLVGYFILIDDPIVVRTPSGPIGVTPTPLARGYAAIDGRLTALENRPAPAPVDLGPITTALEGLKTAVREQGDKLDVLGSRVDDLGRRVTALERTPATAAVPGPTYEFGTDGCGRRIYHIVGSPIWYYCQ